MRATPNLGRDSRPNPRPCLNSRKVIRSRPPRRVVGSKTVARGGIQYCGVVGYTGTAPLKLDADAHPGTQVVLVKMQACRPPTSPRWTGPARGRLRRNVVGWWVIRSRRPGDPLCPSSGPHHRIVDAVIIPTQALAAHSNVPQSEHEDPGLTTRNKA